MADDKRKDVLNEIIKKPVRDYDDQKVRTEKMERPEKWPDPPSTDSSDSDLSDNE